MTFKRNEQGFTLVEMLIVLLIISVLILITVPNVAKHFETVDEKGCSAYVKMVQSQVDAYRINHTAAKDITVANLVTAELLPKDLTAETLQCPDGTALNITKNVVSRTTK